MRKQKREQLKLVKVLLMTLNNIKIPLHLRIKTHQQILSVKNKQPQTNS